MDVNNFEGVEFNGYVMEVINDGSLEKMESGIAKLAVDKGYAVLSDKQKYIFRTKVLENVYDECTRCGLEIPWSEMHDAEFNNGMCGWCVQMQGKD